MAVDPRLWPLGQWDRLCMNITEINFTSMKEIRQFDVTKCMGFIDRWTIFRNLTDGAEYEVDTYTHVFIYKRQIFIIIPSSVIATQKCDSFRYGRQCYIAALNFFQTSFGALSASYAMAATDSVERNKVAGALNRLLVFAFCWDLQCGQHFISVHLLRHYVTLSQTTTLVYGSKIL